MRIDPNASQVDQAAQSESGASSARNAPASAASSGQGTDTAYFSNDQARVQALVIQVNALPEIRQQKVAAIGRAVRDGSYQVSPQQITDSLMSDMLLSSAA